MANLLESRLGNKHNKDNKTSSNNEVSRKYVSERKKTVRLDELETPVFNEEEFEAEQEAQDIIRTEKLKRKKYYNRVMGTVLKVVLILAIFYMVFLAYGIWITEYEYNEKGEIVPVVYSVDEIREREDYALLKAHYSNIRSLYEDIIVLDYRLAVGEDENYIQLSTEYEALLDVVNVNVVQLEAYTPPTEYRQTYNLLLQLVKTDIAVYLQNISAALAQNNSDKANKAIVSKETVYNDFIQATNNMISHGENVKGADITDIKNWSVENVRQERIGIAG